MTTGSSSVVEAELPAEEVALATTFERLPGFAARCERVVENGRAAAMPLLWASGAERSEIDDAFAADPSVEAATAVSSLDHATLYRMRWADGVDLVFEMLTDSGAAMLDLSAADGTWSFRLLYPDRESLSGAHEFCTDHGLSLDVRSVGGPDGERPGRLGLTVKQRETLIAARECGYFDIPRGTDLETLADRIGVSHQALSERLRRANEALVRGTLLSRLPADADADVDVDG